MKVLMLNTFDAVAGADRAARRLQQGLRAAGTDVRLLVQFKFGSDPDVLCPASPPRRLARRLKLWLGTLPVRRYPRRPVNNFTPALLPDRLAADVARLAPDVVHLHWLGAGFCRIETLPRLGRPLLWTLHDSWPFTGGCHVPGDCTRYRERCGACPVLGSTRDRDLSRRVWERKARSWHGVPAIAVAPSRWLADCARSSTLFREVRVEVIPNGLDTERFRPMDRAVARDRLGLPRERPVILFGAVNPLSDPNKGWALLQPALRRVARQHPDALAVIFGTESPAALPEPGMETRFLGRLRDDVALTAAYAAADLLVVPSRQESFCQTAVEAMACATPVAAFAATGLLDLVEHGRTGYLARPFEVDDLADGIIWLLADRARHVALAGRARQKVETEFALDRVAARYLALYHELAAIG